MACWMNSNILKIVHAIVHKRNQENEKTKGKKKRWNETIFSLNTKRKPPSSSSLSPFWLMEQFWWAIRLITLWYDWLSSKRQDRESRMVKIPYSPAEQWQEYWRDEILEIDNTKSINRKSERDVRVWKRLTEKPFAASGHAIKIRWISSAHRHCSHLPISHHPSAESHSFYMWLPGTPDPLVYVFI